MAEAAARLRGGSVYEDSNVRLVYMAKYVYAVQGGAAGAAGAGAQHDLGVAVFGRVNEETQFVSIFVLFVLAHLPACWFVCLFKLEISKWTWVTSESFVIPCSC